MDRVFTRLGGGRVDGSGSTVSVRLLDSEGNEHRISLVPEVLDDLAIHLLELKAGAEHRAQGGIPPGQNVGDRFRAKAMPIVEFGVDYPDQSDKIVINFWNAGRAHFCFSMPRDSAHLLRTRLDRKLGA